MMRNFRKEKEQTLRMWHCIARQMISEAENKTKKGEKRNVKVKN